MAGLIYLSEIDCLLHALASAAFTGSPGDATGWDAVNTTNLSPSLGWKASLALTAANSPFRIAFDMGAAITAPTFFAALGLTLPDGATLDLIGDDAPTYDSDLGAPQVIINLSNYTSGDEHTFIKDFAATTKRYQALRITHGGTDGTVIVGECYMGAYTQLTREPSHTISKTRRMTTVVHETIYGELWAYRRNTSGIDSYSIEYADQSDSNRDELLALHTASQGGGRLLAMVLEPDSATASVAKDVRPVRLGSVMQWEDDLNHTFDTMTVRVVPVQRA